MNLDRLTRYNLPSGLIESWRKYQGDLLLPLQCQALKNFGLLQNQSLLISSPTSSGKTFCGELAAAKHLTEGRKVLFLVPLKALAEEKYRRFKETYGSLGVKILISTADHPENDARLEKGSFDLALLVYEKFNQLLVKNLSLLRTVSLIIIDELQLIFDSSRSATLEMALAKTRLHAKQMQVIGLSSVLDNARELAEWLGCQLLVQRHRPAELFQGVLWQGTFRYRAHNSGQEQEEEFEWLEDSDPLQTLFANLEKLVRQDEQVLVFLKSKSSVENSALLFAERVNLPSASQAIDELSRLEPTSGQEKLLQALQGGIAFHNADLTYAERSIVEETYLRGEIKVIFCTTTLSLGVNLPAKTVFLEPQKYQNGNGSDKSVLLPIEWAEFENICGRAGRFGQQESGRAILIAGNQFEAQALWERYIEAKPVRPQGQLFQSGIEEVILDYAASVNGTSLAALQDYLKDTLSYRLKPLEFNLESAINKLCQQNLLFRTETQRIEVTNLGRVAALQNISATTACNLQDRIKQFRPVEDFSFIYSLLAQNEAREIYPYLTRQEKKGNVYRTRLAELVLSGKVTAAQLTGFLNQPEILTAEAQQRLKAAFILTNWMEGVETRELELKYQTRAGQIQQMAEQISWLCFSAALIAQFISPEIYPHISTLAQRLKNGVTSAGLFLAGLKIPGLGRTYIHRLEQAGLADRLTILEAGEEYLQRYVPENVARALLEKLSSQVETLEYKTETSPNVLLIIEGKPVKNRLSIIINQKEGTLAAKSFKILLKLAVRRLNSDEGWLHKDEIEPGFNQSRYISRLKKELIPYLAEGCTLIENNRLGSYRLKLDKEEIGIEWGNLEGVEDEEVRSLIEGR